MQYKLSKEPQRLKQKQKQKWGSYTRSQLVRKIQRQADTNAGRFLSQISLERSKFRFRSGGNGNSRARSVRVLLSLPQSNGQRSWTAESWGGQEGPWSKWLSWCVNRNLSFWSSPGERAESGSSCSDFFFPIETWAVWLSGDLWRVNVVL